jgi:ribose transport system permease protein
MSAPEADQAIDPASEDLPPRDDRALPPPSWLGRAFRTRSTWILVFDIVLVIVFGLTSPGHVFWSGQNVQALLLGVSEGLLLALGLSMMLGAAIFDLSLGANLVLSSVVGASVTRLFQTTPGDATSFHDVGVAMLLGFIASVATGALFGLVNGVIIAVAKINSLIATLATMGVGTGAAYLLTGGSDLGGLPVELQTNIGLRSIGVIPLPAVVALAVLVVLFAVVRFSRYGVRIQAIGSSAASAERAGLKVRSYLLSLTVLAGALAGVAGFIDLGRFASTSLQGHQNDALSAVTAAVIGGTLLAGGSVSIIGTLWGAALAVILQAGLVISGVSSFWQLIVVGVVLLIAVMLDRLTSRRRLRA